MAYVYVLVSLKDKNRYIGSTIDVQKRLFEHNCGQVLSTKNRRPLKLFAYQKCCTISEARIIEHQYKKSRGRYEKAIKDGVLKIIGV